MGLFNFFRRKKANASSKASVLLAMPMYNHGETYDLEKLLDHLRTTWHANITGIHGDNHAASFSMDGEHVALLTMPAQIPFEEIKSTTQYAYNWKDAEHELKDHDTHVIATVLSSKHVGSHRFTVLSKVLSALLSTSNAIGVYKGTQSLLIPRSEYLESATLIRQNRIPVNLWVYIGVRSLETGNSAYTYGLSAFGKPELEIINSTRSPQDIYSFLANICSYVIGGDVTFHSGETLGYTEDQKVKITASEGVFVKGVSLKLSYL